MIGRLTLVALFWILNSYPRGMHCGLGYGQIGWRHNGMMAPVLMFRPKPNETLSVQKNKKKSGPIRFHLVYSMSMVKTLEMRRHSWIRLVITPLLDTITLSKVFLFFRNFQFWKYFLSGWKRWLCSFTRLRSDCFLSRNDPKRGGGWTGSGSTRLFLLPRNGDERAV